MTTYAKNTTVDPEKSRSDIEKVLTKYGASGFRSSWFTDEDGDKVSVVEFLQHKRLIRFSVRFKKGTTKQRERSLWRSLLLNIKAKVDSVQAGITEFETEFMPYTVNPSTDRTVAEEILPLLADSDHSGAFRLEDNR